MMYDSQRSTGVIINVISCAECESILLVYRGSNNSLAYRFEEVLHKIHSLGAPQFWYCGPLVGDATGEFARLLAKIRPTVQLIAVNPGSFQVGVGYDQFVSALPYTDVIINNVREAKMLAQSLEHVVAPEVVTHNVHDCLTLSPGLIHNNLYNNTSLVQFALKVMQQGPRIVVITDGAHGAYVIDEHGVYYHPVRSLNIINTVGAGDAFGATFFSYLIEGETVMSALARAMINSASVVHSLDANGGLLSKEELPAAL